MEDGEGKGALSEICLVSIQCRQLLSKFTRVWEFSFNAFSSLPDVGDFNLSTW